MDAPQTADSGRRRLVVLSGFLPALVCAALALYPPASLTRLDLGVYDLLAGSVSVARPGGRVVIVDIDDRSLATIGQWPWRRDVIARLVTRLREMEAAAIALDIVFSEADRQNAPPGGAEPDAVLAEALRGGRVVMGYALTFGEATAKSHACTLHPLPLTLVEPGEDARESPFFHATDALCSLPSLADAAGASGFLNASPDSDGILRRAPLVLEWNGAVYPGLSLAAVMTAAATPQTAVMRVANAHTSSLAIGGIDVPLDGKGNLLLRYRGRSRSFPYISAADVLSGPPSSDTFKDRIVFVGATALGTQELVATAFDRLFTGVEVQATIADNLLTGDFFRRPEHAVFLQALIALAAGLGSALVINRRGVVWGAVVALTGLLALWVGTGWLIGKSGVFLSPLVPTFGLVVSVAAAACTAVAIQMRAAFAELQRARRATEVAAESAEHARSEFLMTVSHELRTPLNAIYGYAQILARGALREDQKSGALSTIERNARVQAQVIDDLLDASQTTIGSLRLDVKDVDFAGVVRSVIDVVRPAIDAKRIVLDVAIDSELPPIQGDIDRLHQAVFRLVSNAIKFTPAEGRVAVRLERAKSSAQLTITDNGVGIEPAFLPHVFEPFRQQDGSTTRKHGGLGLGLSLVRHIVELHGGTVAVESKGAGRGTTSRVRLPLGPSAGPNRSPRI